MPSSDAEIYRALLGALSKLGLRWYVFGAQAAIVHGATRFTEDIDISVDLGNKPTGDLVSAFARAGFALRVPDVDDFVGKTRVLPFLHSESGIPVDVVLIGPGIEELFLERARLVDIEGQEIPVASAEDVVIMKLLAGRPKDLEDVVAVLAAQNTMDVDLVRDTLKMLEQALGQSDLLPLLEQCMHKARGG